MLAVTSERTRLRHTSTLGFAWAHGAIPGELVMDDDKVATLPPPVELPKRTFAASKMPRMCSPAEAIARTVQAGMRVHIGGNAGEPKYLAEALAAHAAKLKVRHPEDRIEVEQLLTPYPRWFQPEVADKISFVTEFLGPGSRQAVNEGRAKFFRCFLHRVPMQYRTGARLHPNVCLVQVAPPKKDIVNLGVNTGLECMAVQNADVVIAEINPNMPPVFGADAIVPLSKIDYLVEASEPYDLFSIEKETTPRAKTIARHVAAKIGDGHTLQSGIGGIPDSTFELLHDRKNLKIWSEMVSTGAIALMESGAVSEVANVGFLLGKKELYEYARENPKFNFHCLSVINYPPRVGQIPKMTCINGANVVDLVGHVCSSCVPGKITYYSGIGGQHDFLFGSMLSEGGLPIVALESTVRKNGKDLVSKIVASLTGPGVSIAETGNHPLWLATEYGMEYLGDMDDEERASTIINKLAHPDFRDWLKEEAAKCFPWGRNL